MKSKRIPGPWKRAALRLSALGLAAGGLAWAAGQVLRDRTWLSGMCFYIPSPLLAALFLLGGIGGLLRGRRRAAAALLLSSLPPLIFTAVLENRWSHPEPPLAAGPRLRLVHWNIFHGHLGTEGIIEEVRSHGPDLAVLSEMDRPSLPELLSRMGPGWSGLRIGTMGIVARGELTARELLPVPDGIEAYLVTWRGAAGTFAVLAVDVIADLGFHRDPALEELRSRIGELRPDLIVGDFNAPRRSRALWPPPAGFRHAYEAAGAGWSYTWPVPCPLYAIDQCLVGARIVPLRYELVSTRRSDHRLQFLEFAITGSP